IKKYVVEMLEEGQSISKIAKEVNITRQDDLQN
ncbi:helix-turn-helix domain-containing protein, partial [Staphylococcus argenteus]|nr:helix-turn-helix domain-containing protein [Staphylococcus argenteus]